MKTRHVIAAWVLGSAFAFGSPVAQSAAPAGDPSGAPTLDQVRNGAVRGVVQGQAIQLKNGVFEGPPFTRGGTERPRVELIERLSATGNLDDSPTAERVVLLRHDAGESGVKVYLAVYGMRGERVANLSTVFVGDRAKPAVLSIAGALISLELVEAGHQTRKIFRLGGQGLELVPTP